MMIQTIQQRLRISSILNMLTLSKCLLWMAYKVSATTHVTPQLAFVNNIHNVRTVNRRLLGPSSLPPPPSSASAENNHHNHILNNKKIAGGLTTIQQSATTSSDTNEELESSSMLEGLGTTTFFDFERDECGDCCMLVDSKDPSQYASTTLFGRSSSTTQEGFGWNFLDSQQTTTQAIDNAISILPIIAPVVAFLTYDEVAMVFSALIEAMANKKWVAVDGGAYQAKIIAPAINGVVVPAISILFATLISNTVATLRQRQLDIRTSLNMEASELRCLQAMVDSFYLGAEQDKCRSYLVQYTSRLIAESQPNVELNALEFTGSVDSEMNGFLSQLNQMNMASVNAVPQAPPPPPPPSSSSPSSLSSKKSSKKGSKKGSKKNQGPSSSTMKQKQQQQPQQILQIPGSLLSETYGAVHRLNAERSKRISALQSTFPVLHYSILSVLAVSICMAFLMETNQELLIFLNAIQLKLLWTMLISTFTALAVVCYDLSDPFRGSYQIKRSVDQLYTIRSAICAADKLSKEARHADSHED